MSKFSNAALVVFLAALFAFSPFISTVKTQIDTSEKTIQTEGDKTGELGEIVPAENADAEGSNVTHTLTIIAGDESKEFVVAENEFFVPNYYLSTDPELSYGYGWNQGFKGFGVTEDMTLYADTSHKLIYYEFHDMISPDYPETVTTFVPVTLPPTVRELRPYYGEYYEYKEFTVNGQPVDDDYVIQDNDVVTRLVEFTGEEYDFTIHQGDEVFVMAAKQGDVLIVHPTYQLYLDANFSEAYDMNALTSSPLTLYANPDEPLAVVYIVVIDPNGRQQVLTRFVPNGASLSDIPLPAQIDTFEGWYMDENLEIPFADDTVINGYIFVHIGGSKVFD